MSNNKSDIAEEIKPYIEEIVEHKLLELLGNPDSGLKLRSEVRKRLEKSLKSKRRKTIPAKQVAKELNLKW